MTEHRRDIMRLVDILSGGPDEGAAGAVAFQQARMDLRDLCTDIERVILA